MAPEVTHAAPERPPADRAIADGDSTDALAHERCIHHPGRAAVARCSACEQPVCLACVVPVRGRTIGPECLASELDDPDLAVPAEPTPVAAGSVAAVAGAVLALAATIGPWTRTGAGDRILGAWVLTVRWSMVAGVAAVVLLISAWWFRARGSRMAAIVVLLAGSAVAAGSALAIVFPPTFQAASWGPWVGIVGGTLAVLASIASGLRERHPRQGV